MTCKIRIKVGALEVEYEGPEAFLESELLSLLDGLSKLQPAVGVESRPTERLATGPSTIKGTTATIAAKLGVKTGADLATAAAAHLTFVAGKDTFERIELLDAMKSAASFFRSTYRKNLTGILASLQPDTLLESTPGTFALCDTKRAELEKLLGTK